MSSPSPIRALFAATSIVLIVGCQEATEPIRAGSTFVLESVGGASLPAVSATAPLGVTLIADTLVFLFRSDKNTGQVVHHQSAAFRSYGSHSSYLLLYNWHDGVVEFFPPPCPPTSLCAPSVPMSETGRFGPDDLLTITYGSPDVFPRIYRRVQ